MRFKVQPRCVPPAIAARRLGITERAFREARAALAEHGFPAPDPVTGNYDLEAIDQYIAARNPRWFPEIEATGAIADDRVFLDRIAAMGPKRG